MDLYITLAKDLLESLDRKKKGPPYEEVSASMRGEMAVMRLLAEKGAPVTAGSISKALNMTTSRIAAVLGALQKKGLIERISDEEDKRRVLVALTQRGADLCDEKKQQVIRDMSSMLACLGEEDARHFVRLMKRVNDIMPSCEAQQNAQKKQRKSKTEEERME